MENQVETLKQKVKVLENRVEELEEDLYKRNNERWLVESDICTPAELHPSNFESYYNKVLEKYPLLQLMVGFFFSNWSQRKERS